MKIALSEVKKGEIFRYGGVWWIKLDENKPIFPRNSGLMAATFAITENDIYIDRFGDRNNWSESSLRKKLNVCFLENMLTQGADIDAFAKIHVDLRALDGLDYYGALADRIILITYDQYIEYRKHIPTNKDRMWWLVTPYSCANNGYEKHVLTIASDGTIRNDFLCDTFQGVRPACSLVNSTLVEIENNESDKKGSLKDIIDCKQRINALESQFDNLLMSIKNSGLLNKPCKEVNHALGDIS